MAEGKSSNRFAGPGGVGPGNGGVRNRNCVWRRKGMLETSKKTS